MKPRAKRASWCQDIHRNQCAPPAAEETQIQNRPLRPARRSEFWTGRRWRVSRRSGNTNPREERVRISKDIRDLRSCSSWSIEEGLIGNRLVRLARRSDLGLGRRSSVFRRSWNTNPREERVRISKDIRDLRSCSSWSMQERLTRNRLVRLARRSDFGLGRRSSVLRRSWNTNPREERVRISKDIRDARGRSSWSRKETLIGNRLLRPARRSDLGLCLRSSVLRRSGNTNPRGGKFCLCRDISAARQNNT